MKYEYFGQKNPEYERERQEQELLEQTRNIQMMMIEKSDKMTNKIFLDRLESIIKAHKKLIIDMKENANKLNAVGIGIGQKILDSLNSDDIIIKDNEEFVKLFKSKKDKK